MSSSDDLCPLFSSFLFYYTGRGPPAIHAPPSLLFSLPSLPPSPWRDHPRVNYVLGVTPHHITKWAVVRDFLDTVDGADLNESGSKCGKRGYIEMY